MISNWKDELGCVGMIAAGIAVVVTVRKALHEFDLGDTDAGYALLIQAAGALVIGIGAYLLAARSE